MSALIELVAGLLTIIIEIIFHACTAIYLLIRAVFSSTYRRKLIADWNTSSRHRISMILGGLLYAIAITFSVLFLQHCLVTHPPPSPESSRRSPTPNSDSSDHHQTLRDLKNRNAADHLSNKAEEFLKAKLKARSTQESNSDTK